MRLKAMAGLAAIGAAVAGITTQPLVKEFIAKHLGPSGSKNIWRTLAFVFALLNLKNIPGFWHIRVLRGIVYQLYFQRKVQVRLSSISHLSDITQD